MNATDAPIPVGIWVRMELPVCPNFVGFTYVDDWGRLSARGGAPGDRDRTITIRLPMPGTATSPLSAEEVRALDLPEKPAWVEEFYGPQPESSPSPKPWRQHPGLRGRFHAEYPDDLEVLVHEGGPRLSSASPELVWVRATGAEGDVFRGVLLNQPHNLSTLCEDDEVLFVVAEGCEHPVHVTERYLQERVDWSISPCESCGLSELFDAPSDLYRLLFGRDAREAETHIGFTTTCPLCGGRQSAERCPPEAP